MSILTWDDIGNKTYETGVDHGVLYIPTAGVYSNGVAWNGLTTVTEKPSGAAATPLYADNIKYLNLISAEEFSATIEAFTYPNEFAQFDGISVPSAGVSIGQQSRKSFGLSYRTKKGNDVAGDDFGYKLHLLYGCSAAPSEKAYATINDSPSAISFSWEMATAPVSVPSLKPTSIITIDSTQVGASNLTSLLDALYGTAGTNPRLPLPAEIITMFAGAQTPVTPTSPTFVSTTGVITIPTVTGVVYRRADTNAVVTGTTTIAGTTGASLVITAELSSGAYSWAPGADNDWSFVRTA